MPRGRTRALAGVLFAALVRGVRLPLARRSLVAAAVGAAAAQEEPGDHRGLVAGLFRKMDTDGGGSISKAEFMEHSVAELDAAGITDREDRTTRLRVVSTLFDASDINADEVLEEKELEYAQYIVRVLGLCKEDRTCTEDDRHFQTQRSAQRLRDFDENLDGSVDVEEFAMMARSALRRWGAEDDAMANLVPWLEAQFERADVVADGALNQRELQFAAFILNEYALWDITADVMARMDGDRNELISRREVQAWIDRQRARAGRGNSIPEIVGEVFDLADQDGNGELTYEEAGTVARFIDRELFNDL